MYAVKTEHLKKARGSFVLDDISLSLPKGCIMGLIGENGAGKSTFIELLLGMLQPDSGIVEILGRSNSDKDIMNEIGTVFSEPQLPSCVNVKSIDKIFASIFKNWSSDDFYSYIRRFDIPCDKLFSELSKGNKMKLCIAAALSHGSKLLILDEATAGLDPIVRDDIIDVLLALARDDEVSILMSSHIVSDLDRICDYAAFLHKGRLLLCGGKDELCEGFTLIKCTKAELEEIDKSAIIGTRHGEYASEALIKGNISGGARPSLEDIFLYMIKYREGNSYEGTVD